MSHIPFSQINLTSRDIEEIRKRNLLYPQTQIGSTMSDVDESPDPEPQNSIENPTGPSMQSFRSSDDDELDALQKQYNTPSTVQMKRLEDLLNSYPQHEQPSFMRKLVSSGLAVGKQGSMKESQDFLNDRFNQDLADWKAKATPFHDAAQLENVQNVYSRNTAANMMTARAAAKKLGEDKRQADQKNEIAQTKAENDSIRARAYAAKNNGFTIIVAGTRVVAVNPETKQRIDLGDSGKLDEETKLDIVGEWGVKRAEAQGEAAVRTTQAGAAAAGKGQVKIGDRIFEPDPKNPHSYIEVTGLPEGKPSRFGTSEPKPPTAGKTSTLEKIRVRNEKLAAAYQTDPNVKQFIRKVGEGKYDFKPRPTLGTTGAIFGMGGTTATQHDIDMYDEFRGEVDPDYVPPKAPIGSVTTPTAPYKTYTASDNPMSKRRTNDGGKTYEYSSDGGKTWKKR